MRATPKNVLILFLIVCSIPVFWILLVAKQDVPFPHKVSWRYEDMQDRLQVAELVNKQRNEDLQVLRGHFQSLMHRLSHTTNKTNSSLSDILKSDMTLNLSNTKNLSSDGSLQLPSLLTYLPHIIGKPESLKPSFQLSRNRYGASIVIGVPTIRRDKISYLNPTLSSLIGSMSKEERNDCLIIVFIAEPEDPEYVQNISLQVQEKFSEHIESGLLEVISPPSSFYPDFNNVKQTYGDTKERVRWRTKQNLDFSFLMLYARTRGVYYVQLEDDVISKPGFFTIMKTFAEQQTSSSWILLEFSTLGFIGKMFKSKDLPMVVEFFLMFYKDKPIDWLLDYLLSVKVCNPEKDYKHCSKMKGEVRRRYKPSLFQHVGTHSSLKGKVQKLKEKDFGKLMLYRAHVNPKADLTTSLRPYQKFSLKKAYTGEDIFWAIAPSKGDYVEIKLRPPVVLEEILIRTGNPDHQDDLFYNASLLIKPAEPLSSALASKLKSDFYLIAQFSKGFVDAKIDEDVGKIECIKVLVNSNSDNWVIISEIHVKEKKIEKKKSW